MNAERLRMLAQNLREEMEAVGVRSALQQLQQGLEGRVNQPADPNPQATIVEAVSALGGLAEVASNELPVGDRQILDDTDLSPYLGQRLLDTVTGILQRNEMTPAVALDEIRPLVEHVDSVASQLAALVNALSFLHVEEDRLDHDCEIAVTIPRSEVDEELDQLGLEFREIQSILQPFQEVLAGHRAPIHVRTIASSNFTVFVAAAPVWALGVVKAIQMIVDTYSTILDIRIKRNDLAAASVPEEILAPLDAHANERMATQIDSYATELAEVAVAADAGRKNELVKALRIALNKIANRIDHGYTIDVRTPELPAPAEEADDDEAADTELRELYDVIRQVSAVVERFEVTGDPILSLPEGDPPGQPNEAAG